MAYLLPSRFFTRPVLLRAITGMTACLLLASTLTACSPTYNWRNIPASAAPFSAMLPGKSESATRTVHIGSQDLSMTMTSAEADNAVFAIGSADAGSDTAAIALLPELQKLLIKNLPDPHVTVLTDTPALRTLTVRSGDVHGAPQREMQIQLIAKGQWIFQLVVISEPGHVPAEQSQTFFTSFVPS